MIIYDEEGIMWAEADWSLHFPPTFFWQLALMNELKGCAKCGQRLFSI
jgi:hypothetical protein